MSRASGISTQGVSRLWVAGDAGTQGAPAPFMLMSKDGGMSWEQQTLPDLKGDLISHHSAVIFGAAGDSVQVFAVTASADFESGGRILSYRAKLDGVTAVQDQPALPAAFTLSQNYPNPFNPTTAIRFQLPVASDVKLAIYNTMGQLVRTLASGEFASGAHSVVWDATDDAGVRVASGVYLYRLQAGAFVSQRKLLFMK